jgi:hypothetical protein
VTHDELLLKLQHSRDEYNYVAPHNALRAVIELHKPKLNETTKTAFCLECSILKPCPTIQAIEKELA